MMDFVIENSLSPFKLEIKVFDLKIAYTTAINYRFELQ